MKAKKVALFGIVGFCMALAFKLAFAELRQQPTLSSELVGAWVGYEDGCVYFYRLVLETNNKGSCVVLFNDDPPDSYRVDEWRAIEGKLSLRLSPVTEDAEIIAITPSYLSALKMELVVRGVTNKWERKVSLYNERELLNRVNRTTKRPSKSRAKQ